MLTVKVEVWSDYTCPYCYLGNKNLEIALEKLQLKQHVKMEFKSFRLNPPSTKKMTQSAFLHFILNKDNDKSEEEVQNMIDQMNEQAKLAGISFRFNHIEIADTFNAHRLTKYAERHGKGQEIAYLIFKKYFSNSEDIGKNEVLLNIAAEVGLDKEEVDALLCLNQYGKTVQLDEEMAREIGIDKVPFFIFNDEYAVVGAQPVEVFLEVLEEVKQQLNGNWEQQDSTVETVETMYCTGSECGKVD